MARWVEERLVEGSYVYVSKLVDNGSIVCEYVYGDLNAIFKNPDEIRMIEIENYKKCCAEARKRNVRYCPPPP